MGRQKTYRLSALTALDVVLQFADWAADQPGGTIDDFLGARFPWLDYRGFRAHVGLIEERYGVTVFAYAKQKSGRNGLTEEGRRFVRWARKWVREADPDPDRRGERHTIASFAFSMTHILSPAVAGYYARRAYTLVRLTFREFPDPRRALDAVGDRRRACAFLTRSRRLNLSGHNNEVDFRPLTRDIYPVLIFPRDAPVRPDALTPDGLAGRRFVVPNHLTDEWATHLPLEDPVGLSERVRVHTNAEVLSLVRRGVGCAIFPGIRPGLLDDPGVRSDIGYLPLPGSQPIRLGVALPKHFDADASPGLKEFVAIMSEELDRPGTYLGPGE